jgi:hypothetical protein
MRERAQIADRHVIPSVHQRACLRREDQRLRRAESGAPLHPILDERKVLLAPRPRGVDQPNRVTRDLLGHDHLAYELLVLEDLRAAQHPVRHRRPRAGSLGHHLHFVVLAQIGDDDVEHEAIELRFRQRVGPFELDRILRREHEERTLERIGSSRSGDVIFLHCLQQRRLSLRRRPVDLVGQENLREDRPLHEPQAAVAAILVEDFRTGDVGRHQIGRELDPFEREVEDLGKRLDQQRFRQARHAGDQAVAAGEQGHQHLIDDRVLSDDDLSDFGEDAVASEPDAFGYGGQARLGGRFHQCVSE